MSRRPTISDVAQLCGVTPATVSRVLNRKREFSASAAVREKIMRIAKDLGYAPDLAARNLTRTDTKMIALLASPWTHLGGINEPLMDGIARALNDRGYEGIYELSAMTRESALPLWRVDGALLLQAPKSQTVDELDRRGVPYVCVNERVGKAIANVLADESMGANLAVKHLVELGHQRIAYANAPSNYFRHYSIDERPAAILRAAKHAGVSVVEGHDQPFTSGPSFLNSAVREHRATAVISYDHRTSVIVASAAHAMRLRIPDDFSLIGFNDLFPVDLVDPALSAISVPGDDIGRMGVDHLINYLSGGQLPACKEIRVPESLVLRESTGPAPRQF